ncbi:MAG: hypothetical protein JKY61_12300 [Planctomycetes bacterium]|nr:hypothetical protein [Planctomycetota bacterium]
MLDKFNVLRQIPEHVLTGLFSIPPQFTEHGGVIRRAAGGGGGGQIVAHLLTGNTEAIQGIRGLQGLTQASLALQGVNLAVTAAGFIYIAKKIDRLQQDVLSLGTSLSELHSKIDTLASETDYRLFGKMLGNAEAIAEAIAGDRSVMLDSSLANAKECLGEGKAIIHRWTGDASSVKQLYASEADIARFPQFVQVVAIAESAVVQGYAHLGASDLALTRSESLVDWHTDLRSRIKAPVQQGEFWVGQPQYHQQPITELLQEQKVWSEGLEFQRNTLRLCRDHEIDYKELASLTAEEELLWLEVPCTAAS